MSECHIVRLPKIKLIRSMSGSSIGRALDSFANDPAFDPLGERSCLDPSNDYVSKYALLDINSVNELP